MAEEVRPGRIPGAGTSRLCLPWLGPDPVGVEGLVQQRVEDEGPGRRGDADRASRGASFTIRTIY